MPQRTRRILGNQVGVRVPLVGQYRSAVVNRIIDSLFILHGKQHIVTHHTTQFYQRIDFGTAISRLRLAGATLSSFVI